MDRKEIAIVYIKRRSWIAGAYYVQNLLSALNCIADQDKPNVNVFCDSEESFCELKRITGYPYINLSGTVKFNFIQRIVNKFYCFIYPDKVLLDSMDMTKTQNVFIFPFLEGRLYRNFDRILPWKPDFQEKYYPHFFSKKEIAFRDKWMRFYLSNNIPIVFSSRDAANDCKKFYPDYNVNAFILPFAVTHPDYSMIDKDDVYKKFGIDADYFFVANQFWAHKNHLFLFTAYKKYRDLGGKKILVCSGQLQDKFGSTYVNNIKTFVAQNNLNNCIKILGFIDRNEQLRLMKESYAIIQPSLFEGWSTVVEDAKAMNKFIFLSNLRVHKEQNPANVCYFDPYDIDDLTRKMLSTDITSVKENYQKNILAFGESFLSIINRFK